MEGIAKVGMALAGLGGILLVIEAILVFADAAVVWLQGLTYGVLGIGLVLWAIGALARPKPPSA